MLVWALTGAFYPAIDLCAGEKERGTLETLLSSPAMRSEMVWGKLLAIMLFSMATSLLNLASMGVTGTLLIGQLQLLGGAGEGVAIGPPPLAAMGWLVLGLVPISALFSALALAIAALARSTKEGQYYLLPVDADHDAADDPAHAARRRTRSGQQPDPRHRHVAVVAST